MGKCVAPRRSHSLGQPPSPVLAPTRAHPHPGIARWGHPLHSRPTSLPCTLRAPHTLPSPRNRSGAAPSPPHPAPQHQAPWPQAHSPLHQALPSPPLPSVPRPPAPTGSHLADAEARARPPIHTRVNSPAPRAPSPQAPPPLTLALKLADDGVQEGVLRRDVAPPHRHPEPMDGPGGPPPTPARPGPTLGLEWPGPAVVPAPRGRAEHGRGRDWAAGAGSQLSSLLQTAGPAWSRLSSGRRHTCLPAPAEPRAPVLRVPALRSARPCAGLPAPTRRADSRSSARGSGCACGSARPRKG